MADDAGAEPPTEEELVRRLEEELRKLTVSDVLMQTVLTVSSLGFRKLGEEERDLAQARLAIEAVRALVPVLRGVAPPEVIRDLNQSVANMQFAYAKALGAPVKAAEEPKEDG